ncbi:hypothetical protein KY290_007876 [Solanum tuberosum]|uniref:Uncharacterized protein n=1 Tax=Solanum tuberosum TaxID=4113 RepID=A0ABQ7W794_SOLTU|nr:hypothetical protein KY290_007876 [Solanum tuberosum]
MGTLKLTGYNYRKDGSVDGLNHISVCLAIAETSPLQSCWEEWSNVFTISRLNGFSQNVFLMKHSESPLTVTLLTTDVFLGSMFMSSITME